MRVRSFLITLSPVEGLTIKNPQIALPLAFDRQYSFANFYTLNDQTELLVNALKHLVEGKGESLIGLWGREDSGKTHLINACAVFAHELNISFQSYDAQHLLEYDPETLGDIADAGLLFIDNLDCLCGRLNWERAIYQLINLCQRGDLKLVFSTSIKPAEINCLLEDLRSRLVWGLLVQLSDSDDSNLRTVIDFRANRLGLELTDEVLNYMTTRIGRRFKDQIQLLQKLDQASLIHQKKITIPFIKKIAL